MNRGMYKYSIINRTKHEALITDKIRYASPHDIDIRKAKRNFEFKITVKYK